MRVPFDWTFAVLCVFQGVVVAAGWRRRWHLGTSRLVGFGVPIAGSLFSTSAGAVMMWQPMSPNVPVPKSSRFRQFPGW